MAASSRFNIGLIQMAMSADPADNLKRGLDWLEKAAAQGGQVLCLPELFTSRYFCQREDQALFDLAEPIPGPTTKAISAFAAKAKVTVIVPLFEKRAPGLYHNSVAYIGPDGGLMGLYRKMHIPDDPAYYEKFYFTPGDLGFKAFDTEVGRVGTLICWDQWYPEGARLTALKGANVLFYPTAIGWHPHEKEQYGAGQRDAWRTIQRGHAIANGVYVAAANRTGFEPQAQQSGAQNKESVGGAGIEFWGSSFIADPFGKIVAEGSKDKEEVLIAEIDLAHLETVRRNWPFLRDRRIDAYAGIEQRFLD
jgi:N-carbamoylputrescine amidase